MKSTGIVRKVDELGRIVIPMELRNKLKIGEKIFEGEMRYEKGNDISSR